MQIKLDPTGEMKFTVTKRKVGLEICHLNIFLSWEEIVRVFCILIAQCVSSIFFFLVTVISVESKMAVCSSASSIKDLQEVKKQKQKSFFLNIYLKIEKKAL
jgi:hypothetical protein